VPKPSIIGNQIKEFLKETGKGEFSTKEIRENYLEILYDFGFIDKAKDLRNKTRDIYWPTDENSSKSSFIVESSFNESCVRACMRKILKQRFSFEYKGQVLDQDQVIKYIINPNEIVVSIPDFELRITNDEMTINDDFTSENLLNITTDFEFTLPWEGDFP